MALKYTLVAILHFVCTATILKFSCAILPSTLTNYYFFIANFLLCVVIANLSFDFAKKLFLNERVSPNGKAVFITGSSRGIGHALAKQLDARGYHVFASCRNPNSPGADDLRKSCSSRLKIVQTDVSDEESVKKSVDFVKNNLGNCELWAIVNNAGMQNGNFLEFTSVQDFMDELDVNTVGQIRVTKAFLPLLRKSKGRLINMASASAKLSLPFVGPYATSKSAAVGFTECLRYELDMWGIKVVSFEPDFFDTDMTDANRIKKDLEATFDSLDEDVRRDYGEEFLKAAKDKFTVIIRPSPKLQKLIDAMDDAISLKDPDPVYMTARNKFVELFFKVSIFVPIYCRLLFFRWLEFFVGMPKPRAA